MPSTRTGETASKPTILVLATTYPRWANDHEPGFVHELCRRLVDRYDVIVVTPDAPGADHSDVLDGVSVTRYRYAPRSLQTLVNDGGIASNLRRAPWKWLLVPGFILGQWLAARRAIARNGVSIIHAHWLISPGVVARILSNKDLPYVVTSHGGDLFGFRQPALVGLKRWVAARAAAMTVVSEAMADEVRRVALPVESLQTIPMGVDMTVRFAPDNSIRSSTELLFVGRLVAKKGLNHLIEALPAILSSRPDVTLHIVGFGPERLALEALSKKLQVSDRVLFVGAVPPTDLPSYYRNAAVFIAPFVRDPSGDQEGLPVALMEAVATGCPFVVGDVPGLDDLIGASSPFRVNPRDTAALADAVLARLSDPVAARDDAERVRSRALARIEWSVVAERYGSLLATCIEGRRQ
ncbi:MAG TPA: glycosyltransferase family 4 protein [Luteibacter sp.]|uniref:glycosyltransferase family 4 protein n=1 Tax=Luteibacter sp. TaxID=1886636 RepID=UPI002CF28392|nr:glycosyltransferase family 4 protein [Luteibacter sp.]HVI55381.1 glycosyltransferase family 4 protein [Luteibacter sp.]